MKTNQEYKNAALNALDGNWAPAILATAIFFVLAGALGAVNGVGGIIFPNSVTYIGGGICLACILVIWPVSIGFYNAFKVLAKDGDDQMVTNMFSLGFQDYGKTLLAFLLIYLIMIAGICLLIVPGFIFALMYSQVPFILRDYPEMPVLKVFEMSRKMMIGRKWRFFVLWLSFLGWWLLSILTLGVGFLWFTPYIYTTFAEFYLDAKAEYEAI